MKKRVLSLFLAVLMVFMAVPKINVFADDESATRGYIVNEFVLAVGKNNFPIEKQDITNYKDYKNVDEEYIETIEIALGNELLKGYEDNTLRLEQTITRVEALVMLSRALKDVPQIVEFDGFADTPSWAVDDINRLAQGGILLGYGDGRFGADDLMTVQQIALLTQRIESQYNTTRLEDDFYEAVNAKWIRNNSIPSGYTTWSVADQLEKRNNDLISEMIKDFANNRDSYESGSNERKIADFYLSALDLKKRDEAGINPVLPYLNLINDAKNINELLKVMGIITNSTGISSLLPLGVMPDLKKSEKNRLYLEASDVGIDPYYFYNHDTDKERKAYEEFLTKLFILSGEAENVAERKAKNVFNMQKDLAGACLSYLDYEDFNKIYNEYSIEGFTKLFGRVDIKAYLKELGLQDADSIIIQEVALTEKVSSYLNNNNNLQLIKDYMAAILLKDVCPYLTTEFRQAIRDFDSVFIEKEGNLSDEQIAINITCYAFGWPLGKVYIENYFSEQEKRDVEAMVQDIIRVYKKRIQSADWLSEQTKANAIKKLDKMRIKIGYPDEWPTYLDNVEITSPYDGGSLFENISNISAQEIKYNYMQLDEPTNREEWIMYPHQVNAYYSNSNNEIVLPAGIIQEPFYNINAPKEKNIGAIGTVIAHEISHAFDSYGAKYDEDGNYNNWWTDEDYKNFEKKTEAFVKRYDKIEVIPGKYLDGRYTLRENIADVSAMACILDLAGELENPDLDMLFKSYAAIWACIETESATEYYLVNDEHSPPKVRVNATLQNFKEFYDLYEITVKDGMYVPPPERVRLW